MRAAIRETDGRSNQFHLSASVPGLVPSLFAAIIVSTNSGTLHAAPPPAKGKSIAVLGEPSSEPGLIAKYSDANAPVRVADSSGKTPLITPRRLDSEAKLVAPGRIGEPAIVPTTPRLAQTNTAVPVPAQWKLGLDRAKSENENPAVVKAPAKPDSAEAKTRVIAENQPNESVPVAPVVPVPDPELEADPAKPTSPGAPRITLEAELATRPEPVPTFVDVKTPVRTNVPTPELPGELLEKSEPSEPSAAETKNSQPEERRTTTSAPAVAATTTATNTATITPDANTSKTEVAAPSTSTTENSDATRNTEAAPRSGSISTIPQTNSATTPAPKLATTTPTPTPNSAGATVEKTNIPSNTAPETKVVARVEDATRSGQTPAAQQPPEKKPHPLVGAIELARKSQAALKDVKDYTAVFVKRERIRGNLIQHTMDLKLRQSPHSVYLKWVEPYAGREVMYVEGQNNGKLLAHETGIKGLVGTLALAPTGSEAMAENHYPITQLGMSSIIKTVVAQWESDMKYADIDVKIAPSVRVGDVDCQMIQVTHLSPKPHVKFQKSCVYFDKKTMLPVKAEQHAFPKRLGEAPQLDEEYSFTKLQVNVGLTNADFDTRNKAYRF